jgi:iron(III) transport system ATP-binding protein
MNRGRIEQIGGPREIYERPVNQFVADFIGTTNFLDATVSGPDAGEGFYRVRCQLGELKAFAHEALTPSDKVVLSVRPEDIHLSETRPPGENVWEGRIDQKVFLGESADWQVAIGERRLQSRVHPSLRIRTGEQVYVRIDPEKCIALKP